MVYSYVHIIYHSHSKAEQKVCAAQSICKYSFQALLNRFAMSVLVVLKTNRPIPLWDLLSQPISYHMLVEKIPVG
jgi:hypothetical protein